MSIEFKYLDSGIGFGFTARGNFSGKELIGVASNAYRSGKALRKNKYGIIDYSSVEKFDVSNSDVQTIAELSVEASKISPDRIIAVIANADLSYGYSRMWEFLSNEISWERMVFRSKNEAEEWLKKRVMEKFNLPITIR